MTFEITHTTGRKAIPLGPDVKGVKFVACERYVWVLKLSNGSVACRSAVEFDSAEEARANIAAVKPTLKASRFAKVVEMP